MRTGGGYTLHQSLTLESASIVKQAVSLARRRGHAQVTPLHVASAMLSSSTNLLKRACLQSHSHPLQCKALELCFNVALNRLPTSASTSPLLGPHSHLPSLSNALVAAFKRAQAHQRRGSIENQQQPILALKVEIEQLVISILDDPSVSRVMREAGFSSTQVKSNVEQVVSLEKCSSNQNSPAISGGQPRAIALQEKEKLATTLYAPTTSSSHHHLMLSSLIKNTTNHQAKNDDVMTLLEAMKNNKTRNTVIVGECAATAETLIKGLIEKFDKRDENIPSDMKYVQFISVPLFTLRNISREDFEVRLGELRSLVKSYVHRGVALYLGDLDWVSDFWSKKYGDPQRGYGYHCHVEYMIMEISRLICGSSGEINKRLWLMGNATFQTYAKCKIGRPSLETLWCLHPLTVPVGSLALSLSLHSGMHDQVKKEEQETDEYNWILHKSGIKKQLICCKDCSINFNKEAQALISSSKRQLITNTTSSLPSWLQQYKDERTKQITDAVDRERDEIKDLCKKWNSICSSIHRKPHFLEKVFNLSTPSPSSSSTSTSSNPNHQENKFLDNLSAPKPDLLSNPNSSPNSASSSEATSQELLMELMIPHDKFKNLNSDNLNLLANALENKAPWQNDIVRDIATTILECRSGLVNKGVDREETWMFFLGVDDRDGKEIIAREIAKTVFGSHDNFVSIGISDFASTTKGDNGGSTEEEVCNKRARNENGGSIYDRFLEGVRDNPSRVFYMHDFDQIDRLSLKGFERVIRDGSFRDREDGETVLVKDAVVIFSCDNFDLKGKSGKEEKDDGMNGQDLRDQDREEQCGLLDLNISTDDDRTIDSVSENGILDAVDKKVVFKIQSLVN